MLIRIAIAVFILAIVAVGVFFILRTIRKKKEKSAAPPPPPKDPQKARRIAELRTSLSALVAEELKQLDQNVGGVAGRYSMPWCLVLSEKGAGQSTVLQNTGLHIPFRGASDQLAESAHCRFWFYDKGIAIDLGSEIWQEEEVFVHFCHLLRAARPKRPVDSVLVLVAADNLVGDDKLTEEHLKANSELLYQRLLRFQQEISLRLPTYVMISKSDTIPGFTAFCGGLSSHQREQLAGWSSPHPLNVSYSSSWVDQAFAELYNTQCGLQLDLLASARLSDKEQDLAFLLPRNTQALRDPMKTFLDQLFRVSVYSESNLLRGVYMCGDATIASAMVQKSENAEGQKHPVFIHDLFAKKLFPESGLAKPLKKGMMNQQRALRLVRVALGASVLVSVLLLWTAYANLSRDVRAVMGFLDKVPVGTTLSVAQDKDRFAQQTQELLAAIGNVANSRLFSVRLPSSWLSSLDDDVQEAMRRSFERVVLGGLHEGLALKAKQVLGPCRRTAPRPAACSRSLRRGATVATTGCRHRRSVPCRRAAAARRRAGAPASSCPNRSARRPRPPAPPQRAASRRAAARDRSPARRPRRSRRRPGRAAAAVRCAGSPGRVQAAAAAGVHTPRRHRRAPSSRRSATRPARARGRG